MTRPRLEAADLSWAAGSRFILLDLGLRLEAGSLTVITGGNGAGKTSLMRILNGTTRPNSGEVRLDGVPLPEVKPGHLARRIAMLGHKPGLFLDLNAAENLRLFAALAGRPLTTGDSDDLLDHVGIAGVDRGRPVRHFSRGMQQRTGLGRILATGADVWLLDEPSTGLDRQGRQLLAQITGQARDDGSAVMVITHDPEVRELADRHLELHQGRLHPGEVAP